ncbi:glutamyl-tRNA reductase [Flammeovirga sp. MY04]|uniref:glutamyl-tRNA reductase n=1 Tax=Flammeovirga sp. MY04 TaxID=1191459 RepID=UPI000806421C|nr:glutamyl-tRNA reductase [Flammeovirga sp. MY04]ANQ49175.1 glutamyl-tRNA reductase [Flammeovirga sp. MY04]
MNFYTFSISHRNATINIREKFYLSDQETSEFLLQLNDTINIQEAIVLSTCNRMEVYYLSESNQTDLILKLLCAFKCELPSKKYYKYIDSYEHEAGIKHLLEVGMGVDSFILGDLQIYGQLKNAYNIATEVGMCKSYLHRLMHTLFNVHKKVFNETEFLKGATSCAYNAAKLLKDTCLPHETTLIIGIGDMGKNVAGYLSRLNVKNVFLTNRTMSKAIQMCNETGFQLLHYDQLNAHLSSFDHIISCVDGNSRTFGVGDFDGAYPKTLIDLGTPRSINSQLLKYGCQVLNIDDLSKYKEQTLATRKSEIEKVNTLIQEGIHQFALWKKEQNMVPTVRFLKQQLQELRELSLANFKKEMNPEEIAAAEKVSNQLINKIISLPAVQLRKACQRGDSADLSEALTALFTLDKEEILS